MIRQRIHKTIKASEKSIKKSISSFQSFQSQKAPLCIDDQSSVKKDPPHYHSSSISFIQYFVHSFKIIKIHNKNRQRSARLIQTTKRCNRSQTRNQTEIKRREMRTRIEPLAMRRDGGLKRRRKERKRGKERKRERERFKEGNGENGTEEGWEIEC